MWRGEPRLATAGRRPYASDHRRHYVFLPRRFSALAAPRQSRLPRRKEPGDTALNHSLETLIRPASRVVGTILALAPVVPVNTSWALTPTGTKVMRHEALTGFLLLATITVSPAAATAPLETEAPPLLRPYEVRAAEGHAKAIAVGDLNGDGLDDVVLTSTPATIAQAGTSGRLLVFLQGKNGKLAAPVSYAASAGYSVALGDVNGDGKKDVVVDGVGVFLQSGGGKLRAMETHAASEGSQRVRVADFNGDRRDDVASLPASPDADDVELFLQEGGALGPGRPFALRQPGCDDLDAGDVNGDGRADLVVVSDRGSLTQNIAVLPQIAGGGFGEPSYYDTGEDLHTGVAIGDVNGDGRDDILVISGGGKNGSAPFPHVGVLLRQADGDFGSAVFYEAAATPTAIEVADMDLDGRDDVVVLHDGGQVGVYVQGADGFLGIERRFALPAGSYKNPHGLAVGDVDGDGLPDVVAANDSGGAGGLVVLRHSGQVLERACVKDGTALCLLGGRFEVRVTWKDQHNGGREGVGQAVARSDQSGTFWFFSPASAELTVKALDGQSLNERFWFFYGALSDVEYRIAVLDTATGALRAYVNPPGRICGRADVAAFSNEPGGTSSAAAASSAGFTSAAAADGAPPAPTGPPPTPTPIAPGTCTAGPATLCLLDGRIKVEARWRTRDGQEGKATAVPDSEGSGFFWFFSPDNYELTVKALDGRALNNRFWFFYGALSDVEYWIDITDVTTGKFHTYHNAPGNFCGQGDVAAL
jgi:VCBS repeat protein